LNGVHRVADRLVQELDTLLPTIPGFTGATLLMPERSQHRPNLNIIDTRVEKHGHTQLWEQTVLPLLSWDGLLLNFCNLAPIFHPRKLLMIHDAQFLIAPESYPIRRRLAYKLLIPLMARTSRKVLTVSEYSRQTLDMLGVIDRNSTEVVWNGANHLSECTADTGFFQALGIAPATYVVHFASIKTYKNSSVLFSAFSDERLAGLKLLLLGDSVEKLRKHGLHPPPSAIHAGKVNDGQLRSLYENALCLALPSRTEGFSLPPLEALLCGCPAVVAPAGAIPEVCQDTVLYADVDDATSWVDAIARYRDKPDLHAAKCDAGLKRAQQFSWKAAGSRALDIIVREAQ
jgi:glycosyltransferase involved in cell wall biosynthesis